MATPSLSYPAAGVRTALLNCPPAGFDGRAPGFIFAAVRSGPARWIREYIAPTIAWAPDQLLPLVVPQNHWKG